MPKTDIDYDLHGHCVVCHEDMSYIQIIDGKPERRLSPDYHEEEYLLDDGSKMRVAMCKKDKDTLKDDIEERTRIMDCVFKGWEFEVRKYTNWSEDKKKKHLEVYSKKRIVTRTLGLGEDVIQKRLKAFNNKRKKD